MSRVVDLQVAIATRVQAVPSVGKVYPRLRYVKTVDGIKSVFTNPSTTQDLRAWQVTRVSTESRRDGGFPRWIDTHRFVILGYMSLKDEANTEHTFQDLVEAVRDQFRPERLGRSADPRGTLIRGAYVESPVQVESFEHGELGSAFVHLATLSLAVEDHAASSTATVC